MNKNERNKVMEKCIFGKCSIKKDNLCCFDCDDLEKCKNKEYVCDHALSYNTAEGCPYINHIEEIEPDISNTNNNNNNKITIKVETDKSKSENAGTKTEITTICYNNKEMQFTYEYSSFGNVTMSKGISYKTICGILDFLEIEYFVVLYE